MMGPRAALGVTLLLAMATAAHADEGGKKKKRFLHRGPYLQLGAGLQALKSTGDVDFALNGKVGIDIIRHLALEVQFEGSRDAERFALTFQQRSALLSGRWQPYLVGGIGFSRTQRNPGTAASRGVTGVALRFGGGLDYMIDQNLALSLDTTYVVLTQGASDYGSISLGLRYGW